MGLFIAFEGGDGAGKSLQSALLAQVLVQEGHETVRTREPGATPLGARVRALLLDPASDLDLRCEALLYAADRAQHVGTVIMPALAAGKIVITDRYIDSTLAYQGGGREGDASWLLVLSTWATRGVVPDLTFVLDIDPRAGLAQAQGRGAGLDRIEQESFAFHERIREAFLALARAEPGRYCVIDAELSHEQIADLVLRRTRDAITEAGIALPQAR